MGFLCVVKFTIFWNSFIIPKPKKKKVFRQSSSLPSSCTPAPPPLTLIVRTSGSHLSLVQTRFTGSNMLKFSGLFLDKFTRVASVPVHHVDLVERVSILREELLAIGDNKEQFYSVLDEKGQWLYRSYRDGAGIVELMGQFHPHPYLALQVLDWRRKEVNCYVPLTSEEYAKGIKLAGRAKDINLAVDLFNEAARKRVMATSIYNALMGTYMCNGLAEACQSLFKDFRKQTQCAPSVVTYNILISVYGRLLMINNMEAAFEELCKSKLAPNSNTYNYLIAGYVTVWNWEKMEATFQLMKTAQVKPDFYTYVLMVRGYANSRNLGKMEEMYELIKDQIDENRVPLIRAMICAYCRNVVEDRVKKVENLLGLISEEEYKPWLNVLLIQLYAQEDILEAMEDKINEAFEHKTRVNTSGTMQAIVGSYYRCDASVDSIANFVKRAESAGWKLCRSLYHCMMISYGSQRRFEEMEGVVSEMENFNYGLVEKTLLIMFKAYISHGMEFKAKQVVGKMLKYGYSSASQ
ncbi:PREDICTED: pentatricopeptide repeat-containing protein At2g30780 isoform X3 [Tarenaya hassleriana]|uniref:pentatricopeptide repeat-containing protein At2g30780 isoform X3 n=1 Tax=Tarenaya hassleriana TaxID=28532 RepID=UPI00053C7400|nr:PREDICTED: pentatricopeptide repeat-containing protein At2g30780 isoform X3 [Tarenaya hassleriana]